MARSIDQVESAAKFPVGEEIANAITHGIGTLLSIAGLVLMIVFAGIYGNPWHIVSVSIFGATLVFLYLNSTLYHSITNKTAKHVFKVMDHASIYLLIAGTYTPFTLVVMNGALGWTIFGIVWGLAILGIVLKSIWVDKFKTFSLVMYIVMGWMILLGIGEIFDKLPLQGIFWLALGGVLYTVGTVFFTLEKKIPFFHSIWHLFVIAGSICHFFSVIWYVIPMKM